MKLIATLLIASSAASAFMGCCDGKFSGEAEALYWRATSCTISYARSLSGVETSLRTDHYINPDHDWGFRLGLGYDCNCSRFGVSYLYLQTTDGARVNKGDGDLQIQGNDNEVDFAQTSLKFRYQNVDVRAARMLHQGCDCNFAVTAVARWVDIDMKYRTAGSFDTGYEPPVIFRGLNQCASFNGGGVGIGLAGEYGLPCDFGIGGHFDFAAIIGRHEVGKFVGFNSFDSDTHVSPGYSSSSFIPAGQFDLFISYSRCLCRALWNVKLGYEMHYFWNALRYSAVDEFENDVPNLECYSVGFGGPYIGLSASF
jgi:Legionella pneumophila major outer membrane protein precursor